MYLGLDLGTTNVKALVTDHAGRTVAQGTCPVRLFHVGAAGVEQDIEEIWKATLSAIQQAASNVDAAGIRAIGVSSQGGAMQLLEPGRRPSGRVISWLDHRGQPYADRLTEELGREWLLQRIGHRRAWLAVGQLLRLQSVSPELLSAAHGVGFVGDLVVERLCGRAAHDGTSCGLTLLYNPAQRNYDPDLLARLGLNVHQLPDLISPRAVAGGLLPEVASAVGLSAGIPVSAAIHDQYASALGAGAVRAGMAMVGAGTAWVLLAVCEGLPAPVSDTALVCHHVVNGLCGEIVSLVNGGSALTWALELLGMPAQDAAHLEALLESAPAGSHGLCFWPFLTPFGASGLLPGTTGRLLGLQLSHRPADVVRAVVEGLAFELKRHLAILERTGIVLQELVLTGGAAASRVTPQILADVTGLPFHSSAAGSASALGAAILARGLIEPDRSLADLAGEMGSPGRKVTPGKDAVFYVQAFEDYSRSLPLSPVQETKKFTVKTDTVPGTRPVAATGDGRRPW